MIFRVVSRLIVIVCVFKSHFSCSNRVIVTEIVSGALVLVPAENGSSFTYDSAVVSDVA